MSEYKSEYRKKLRELNESKAYLSELEREIQKLYKKSIEFDMELKHQELIAELQKINNVKLICLHCHFPNRELELFNERVEKMIDLYKKFL